MKKKNVSEITWSELAKQTTLFEFLFLRFLVAFPLSRKCSSVKDARTAIRTWMCIYPHTHTHTQTREGVRRKVFSEIASFLLLKDNEDLQRERERGERYGERDRAREEERWTGKE